VAAVGPLLLVRMMLLGVFFRAISARWVGPAG
jgi:hypothetical protein